VNHSQQLRDEYQQPEIADGWEILAEGEGYGNYGYGSRDTLMYLRGPDGGLYCYEGSCCSCNGLEGSFDPVETNVETIEKDLANYEGGTWTDSEKARVCREALEKIRPSADGSSVAKGGSDGG
jgi:hypothetical protein